MPVNVSAPLVPQRRIAAAGQVLEFGRRVAPRVLTAAAPEDASRTAGLVVVGSRGVSRRQRAVLRSVSGSLLRLSPCPVAVVSHRHGWGYGRG